MLAAAQVVEARAATGSHHRLALAWSCIGVELGWYRMLQDRVPAANSTVDADAHAV